MYIFPLNYKRQAAVIHPFSLLNLNMLREIFGWDSLNTANGGALCVRPRCCVGAIYVLPVPRPQEPPAPMLPALAAKSCPWECGGAAGLSCNPEPLLQRWNETWASIHWGTGPVISWPPLAAVAAWRLLELLEGCARHTSSTVCWPKQGWLAKHVRNPGLGQQDRPSQLAPAENQGKASTSPACGVWVQRRLEGSAPWWV